MNIIESAATTAAPENPRESLATPQMAADRALAAACSARNLPAAPLFLPTHSLENGDLACDLRGPWAALAGELAAAVGAATAGTAQVKALGGGRYLALYYVRSWLAQCAWPTLSGNAESWTIADDDDVCWRLLRALIAKERGASPALVTAAYTDFYRGTIIADRDDGRRAVKEALAAIARS